MRKFWVVFLAVAFTMSLAPVASAKLAGDMEDGIGYDDGIDHGSDLKKQVNISFKRSKANMQAEMAKAQAGKSGSSSSGDDATISGAGGDVNIGSANVGGSVFGDVIILMDGMKNATVVK